MRIRPVLLGLLLVGVVTQIVALTPRLTERGDGSQELQPKALIQDVNPQNEKPLAPGVPQDKVPDYAIEDFEYVSTVKGRRQWKIHAKRAFLFNAERIVSARTVWGELYDPDGQKIYVVAKESKYFMNGRDLELFGAVQATFPDGFRLESEYMLYQPAKGLFAVPKSHSVRGFGRESDVDYNFQSAGLSYSSTTGEVELLQDVLLEFNRSTRPAKQIEKTHIFADQCQLHRKSQTADCLPYPSRSHSARYVQIAQSGRNRVAAKSRQAHLSYVDSRKSIHTIRLTGDVMIAETEVSKAPWVLMERFLPDLISLATREADARYSTSGRADFDAKRDLIILTEYPQVYQKSDTVTGERILLHRDSDLVEIDHSNAYSEGQTL